jgi:hypothetical protein
MNTEIIVKSNADSDNEDELSYIQKPNVIYDKNGNPVGPYKGPKFQAEESDSDSDEDEYDPNEMLKMIAKLGDNELMKTENRDGSYKLTINKKKQILAIMKYNTTAGSTGDCLKMSMINYLKYLGMKPLRIKADILPANIRGYTEIGMDTDKLEVVLGDVEEDKRYEHHYVQVGDKIYDESNGQLIVAKVSVWKKVHKPRNMEYADGLLHSNEKCSCRIQSRIRSALSDKTEREKLIKDFEEDLMLI